MWGLWEWVNRWGGEVVGGGPGVGWGRGDRGGVRAREGGRDWLTEWWGRPGVEGGVGGVGGGWDGNLSCRGGGPR